MSAFYNVDQPPFNMGSTARAIAAANNGLLFDIGDMSTMYQDAAGTIPVTAVEQPVGLILDKSQGLMLGSELQPTNDFSGFSSTQDSITFNNASFTNIIAARGVSKQLLTIGKFYSVTISATSTTEITLNTTDAVLPTVRTQLRIGNGTTVFRADMPFLYVRNTGLGTTTINSLTVRELYGNHAMQSITASRPTLSACKNVLLATETLATQSVTAIAAQYTLSFTGTGSVTLSGAATGTLTGTGADNRVSLTVTPTAGTLTLTVSGSVTKAQLELGAVAGPYQRVNTATDYDTNPALFPKYLKFDGIDDYLNLPYMGLYGGGAASIIAARNAVSQATDTYIISERSTSNANPKYLPSRQLAGGGNMDSYISDDTAAVVLDTIGSAFSGASDKVIRSVVDTGNNIKLFKNGALAADDNYTRAGTLTLNNTTIGASVSTTTGNYASMKLYGLIITKSTLTDAQRVRCERFLARKAGVML